jgi:hypothetical protein
MDISVFSRSYNSYGGSSIFSFVGDLLTARLGDYGSAVESIELIACLPSRTRKFLPTLEKMFDQFHEYVKTLPQITFRRKLKRIELIFLSKHFFADDGEAQKPSAQKCNTVGEEVAEALPLLKKRIKPTDDFALDHFLADASEATVLKLDKADSISLSLCNEAAIALAFAVLKRRAKCPLEIVRMALAALARTAILVKRSRLSAKIKSEWAKAIAKMKGKLESVPK